MSTNIFLIILFLSMVMGCNPFDSNSNPKDNDGAGNSSNLDNMATTSDTVYVVDTLYQARPSDSIGSANDLSAPKSDSLPSKIFVESDTVHTVDTVWVSNTEIQYDTTTLLDTIFVQDTMQMIDTVFSVDTILINTGTPLYVSQATIELETSNGQSGKEYWVKTYGSTCISGTPVEYRVDFGDGMVSDWSSDTIVKYTWYSSKQFILLSQARCKNDITKLSVWSTKSSLNISPAGMKKYLNGTYTENETWHADTVYVVRGQVLYAEGVEVTILPGTHVEYEAIQSGSNWEFASLTFMGNVTAVGKPDSIIQFDWGFTVHNDSVMTYHNTDGRYRAGPRLEYVAIDGPITIGYDNNGGGRGVYLKHSSVNSIQGATMNFASGMYIGFSQVDSVPVKTDRSRYEHSYFDYVYLLYMDYNSPTIINNKIASLRTSSYDYYTGTIEKNIIGKFRSSYGEGKISNNVFEDASGPYQVELWDGADTDLSGNYWGAITTSEMIAKGGSADISTIQDKYDVSTLGTVDYSNWLTQPIPDAGPNWKP
ncbi:MAG: hypothetical protein OCD01_14670 [Fibrobacterales bacterium]